MCSERVLLLSTLMLLVGCGGGNNGDSDEATKPRDLNLSGEWSSVCYDESSEFETRDEDGNIVEGNSSELGYVFTNNELVSTWTFFHDFECTELASVPFESNFSYSLGEVVTTESGLEATKLFLTNLDTGEESVGIFHVNEDILYPGLEYDQDGELTYRLFFDQEYSRVND